MDPAEVLPEIVIGTAVFLACLWLLPLRLEVEAKKRLHGPLEVRTRVWLGPWSGLSSCQVSESCLWEVFRRSTKRSYTGRRFRLRPPMWAYQGLRFISDRLYRATTCRRFEMGLLVGASEAATTGWLAGCAFLWQALIQQNLFSRVRLEGVPALSFRPSFTQPGLEVELNCVVIVRLFHLAAALVAMFLLAGRTLLYRRAL